MATSEPGSINRLRFRDKQSLLNGESKARLKRELGRGVYVNDIEEQPSGDLLVYLGNSVPKDVSDTKNRDGVIKFVNVRDIFTVRAESTGEGYYILDIPDRDEVYEGYLERRQHLIDHLDYELAKVIYDDVFDFVPVRNQLNSVIQIVEWVYEAEPIAAARIDSVQETDNTYDYLDVLEDLSYIRISDGEVSMGEKMQGGELLGLDKMPFIKRVVGNIVKDGYRTLQERLDLWNLGHYPKFSNAYYYPALQKGDPSLWLNAERIQENLDDLYGDFYDTLFIGTKLRELSEADVLEKDGEYVRSNETVYNKVSMEVPI